MATRIRTLVVISALLVSSLFMLMNADPAFSSQPDNKPADVSSALNLGYVPGQVLVEFKEGVSAGRRTQVGAGAGADKTLARLGPRGKKDVHLLQLKAGVSVEQAVRKLRGSNDVVLAEPNYIRHSTVIPMPNDPSFANQWGLFNNGQTIGGIAGTIDADIDAEVAWDSSERSDSNPVTVAVIDSGIDQNHPDLSGSLWRNPGEVAGNGVDDDVNGYVDDVNGFNLAGISMTHSNAAWFMGDTNTSWRGQSITGTGQRLTQVGLLVRRVGTPTANIEIVVRDALSGTDLATATIASGSVGDDWLVIDAALSTPITLTAGSTYYILFRPTAASAANYYVLAGNSDERADWLPDPYRGGGQHWWNGTAWVAGRANADWFFTTNTNANPQDDNGHGTHVSGIIGAKIDNAVGIAGISYGARIMVLKAGSSNGSLTSSDIIEALHYAADNGAKVINMSFGGPVYSSLEKAAIDYAYGKGAALFAAAGNHRATEDPQTFNFPASYPNVVSVAATTNLDTRASFSNYNGTVDVSAPGQDIYSTMPTYAVSLNSATVGQDYAYMSGTSMATPMVVGLAGLILSRNPEYTAAQVMQVIQTTLIDDKGTGGWDTSFGTGRITGVGLANAVSVGNNRIDGMWWAPSPQPPSYVNSFGESLDSQGDRNDFLSVSVAAGQRIRVSMTAPSGTDFDLYLYPPGTTDASLLPGGTGNAVASSVGGTYPEAFSYIPPAGAGGTYYLRVNAKSGRGSYAITYSVMDADNAIPGVPIPASPVNEDLRILFDENDVFGVSLAEGQQIMASLTGSTNTDFGLHLYSPGSADFSSTPVAASAGGGYPRKFKYVVPAGAAGTYYLRAAMIDGSFNGTYTLTYNVGPADVTAPITTLSTSPTLPDGDNGWFKTAPTITLASNEGGVTYVQWQTTWANWWEAYTNPFIAPEGNNTLYYYSVDLSENQETTQARPIKLDMSAPSAPVLSASGDSATAVTLSWPAATDSVSGVFGYRIYDGVSNVLLGTTSALTFTVSGLTPGAENRYYATAVDNAGHESSPSNTAKIATVPVGADVTVTVESVTVAFSSVATAGGVTVTTSTTPPATQTGFQLNGVYYDVSTNTGYTGPITITLPYDPNTAGDPQTLRLYHYDENLGSWIDVTVGVDTVNHTISGRITSFSWLAGGQPQQIFGGFALPINPDGTSVFNLAQTLPVKFHLADADGLPVTDAVARIYIAKVVDGVPGSEAEGTSSTPKVKNVFRYSDTADEYIFNLETKKLSAGVWQLRVLMDDGLSYVVLVSLSSK